MMEFVKVAGFGLSLVSAIATVWMAIIMQQVKYMIIVERDAMKDWVRAQIKEVAARGRY